ncbi:TRAP transporter large permease subunit [uncultured Halovibrio sp.]|uniref:TRAP transporter large permease subunit n=1 Tax=uncultured Halovibrio sp. TaxID=985049 RepID=UPI0025E34F51|nr:TRAP transporter large permease subunit [uncultured Halovibrio sp.]
MGLPRRTGIEWFSSLPACLILLLFVFFATTTDFHNKALQLGEYFWSGYYQLREDPERPDCNPMVDVESEVDRLAERRMDDEIAGLLGESEVDREAIRRSVIAARRACEADHLQYQATKERITTPVRLYRSMEQGLAELTAVGLNWQRPLLILLVAICAATATLGRHQIAIRGIETRTDYRVSYSAQTIANMMLLASSWIYRNHVQQAMDVVPAARDMLNLLWVLCFAVLSMASVYRLLREPTDLRTGGSILQALPTIPLYSVMCFISGAYFLSFGYMQGIGVYLGALMEHAEIFVNVALYVWAGMMLKQTRVATLVFDIFRPLRMPPELLATVAVVVAAIPTAYTGASGIFVIAAGAVIYHELRSAGARRQLALAATAMSGSMGVVLRPCLLVVVIAMLNREVTTDELFSWGAIVFALSAVLFFLVTMLFNRQSEMKLAPLGEAIPEMLQALRPLIPYALVVAAVVLAYSWGLGVGLDEFSAPRILPVMLLSILVFEAIRFRGRELPQTAGGQAHSGFEPSLRHATSDTTAEIGALLLLFGLSISLGGVIERAELMDLFPDSVASPWMAMGLMVLLLVGLGMIMDAFGAVILVSATVASFAYQSGIDPVHFWMVTLVAFELGYLTPPVSLNHLLTRQVVGDEEVRLARTEASGGSFYQRHERIVMPMVVMGTALVLVAFVPLLLYAL